MAPNPTGRALYNSLAASATLTLMNLDLIITTSGYQGSKVTMGEDLGSDHIPVLLSTETKVPDKCHFRPRWRIDEDNWMDWQQVIGQQQGVPDTAGEEDLLTMYEAFNKSIIDTSERVFGLTNSRKLMPPGQPWWNSNCSEAVRNRKRAMWAFYKNPSPANKATYNRASKEAKRVTKEAKQEAWEEFLAKLKPNTPSTIVWRFFGSMNGKSYSVAIPFSNSGGKPVDKEEAADTLAKHYLTNFSHSVGLTPEEEEEVEAAQRGGEEDDINQPITSSEFEDALKDLPLKSSPGEDLIHNKFLTS